MPLKVLHALNDLVLGDAWLMWPIRSGCGASPLRETACFLVSSWPRWRKATEKHFEGWPTFSGRVIMCVWRLAADRLGSLKRGVAAMAKLELYGFRKLLEAVVQARLVQLCEAALRGSAAVMID